MPWKVVPGGAAGCPDGKPFAVVKSDTGERVACHTTQGEAMAQVHALYANEKDMM